MQRYLCALSTKLDSPTWQLYFAFNSISISTSLAWVPAFPLPINFEKEQTSCDSGGSDGDWLGLPDGAKLIDGGELGTVDGTEDGTWLGLPEGAWLTDGAWLGSTDGAIDGAGLFASVHWHSILRLVYSTVPSVSIWNPRSLSASLLVMDADNPPCWSQLCGAPLLSSLKVSACTPNSK